MGSRCDRGAFAQLTMPFNIAGVPAISVPCGFDGEGAPIGLQMRVGLRGRRKCYGRRGRLRWDEGRNEKRKEERGTG
ncbi:MAG: hypothetical protein IPO34_10370 [Dehalococcoidia bacterium]|nr:hypothetical protein [Dehalococcoidia bacterium]